MSLAKVKLIYGLEFDGKKHTDVVLRVPIARDSDEAARESEGKGGLVLACAYLAKCIVEFGGIPKQAIDVDLIMLVAEPDLERLNYALDDLKKNGHWLSLGS